LVVYVGSTIEVPIIQINRIRFLHAEALEVKYLILKTQDVFKSSTLSFIL
jgi:hypothetical protein